MNHSFLHRWAREEALPLPSRTHPQNQKQNLSRLHRRIDRPDGRFESHLRSLFYW